MSPAKDTHPDTASPSQFLLAPEGVSWNGPREQRRLRVYTRLYVLALTLVGVLAVLGAWLVTLDQKADQEFARQLELVRVIDNAGTRVFRLADVLRHQVNEPQLGLSVDLFRSAMDELSETSSSLRRNRDQFHRLLSDDQVGMELFDQLDAQLTSLLKQGGQLLSIMPGLKEGSSEPVHDIAQKMLDGEMAFVHAVEAVRERLEQLLEWSSVQFTQLSLILTAIMLLLLVSTGLFLFRPAGQRIREIGDRLVAANEANAAAGRHLRSLAMELGQRNKELQASLGEVHRLHYAFLAQTGPAAFGTVARGIAGQMESPLRDLRNNTQQCLGLMGELDRELRQGSGRIPLRILDRLQEISSNLAMSLSGQVERMEVLEHLVTMVRRFVPERTEQDNPAQHSNQAEGVPTLRLTDVLLEAVQVFRAAGPELDPPGDPGITLAPAALDDLEIQVDGDESIQAPIPRQKFIAALLELLSNAARATRLRQQYGPAPTGYRRIIGLSVQLNPEEPGGFIIRVMDNGVGMTAEVRARSIEPFFTTKPGGLGMGLTSVMDLVTHELRGRLILTDTPGGGTTVKILLNPQYGPPESIVANP